MPFLQVGSVQFSLLSVISQEEGMVMTAQRITSLVLSLEEKVESLEARSGHHILRHPSSPPPTWLCGT